MKRNVRGITLIALVITIIVLLILAGVTIAQLTGNGLFEKAKLAKEKSDEAQSEENEILQDYEKKISENVGNIITDSNKENSNTKTKILFEGNQSSGKIIIENDKISNYDSFEFIFGICGTIPGERRLFSQTISKEFLEFPFETGDIKYISLSSGVNNVTIEIRSVTENSLEFSIKVTGADWRGQIGEIYEIIGRKN